MTKYFIRLLNRARHLRPQKSDCVIIEAISKHFAPEDEAVLIASQCTTVDGIKHLLVRLDDRTQQRQREAVHNAASSERSPRVAEQPRPAGSASRKHNNVASVNMVETSSEQAPQNSQKRKYDHHPRGRGGKRFRGRYPGHNRFFRKNNEQQNWSNNNTHENSHDEYSASQQNKNVKDEKSSQNQYKHNNQNRTDGDSNMGNLSQPVI
jgi:hypothetical protein